MKIIVGISGGVDSAVTAMLLKQQGHEVEALFMKNWNEAPREDGSGCSWEADVEDALQVCERLDIPLNTIDLSREYWDTVFSTILADFSRGLTPNPDILCNQEIKFTAFLQHALTLGADRIATGHYARATETDGHYELLKGLDSDKDQSYFLSRLNQSQLARALFPIGAMNKSAVRRLAAEAGLIVHDKKDSTGICFIGERPFKAFLQEYLPRHPGEIVNLDDGSILGEHDGVNFYTLGQRQGLGIGGVRGAPDAPWYVTGKDLELNRLYVAQGHDHPALYRSRLQAIDLHWIADMAPELPCACQARVRYRQSDQECRIERLDAGTAEVTFTRPQRAVTPGQHIVFYSGDSCLGGGVISAAS